MNDVVREIVRLQPEPGDIVVIRLADGADPLVADQVLANAGEHLRPGVAVVVASAGYDVELIKREMR